MGNEESQYRKLEVEEEAIEVTDNWSLHYAKEFDGNAYSHSVFIAQSNFTKTDLAPLKKLAKNFMIHRHPSIVKYISSWNKNSKFYLITEKVKPLSLVVTNQSTLQICIGLHSILSAIIFLHEKAQSAHNNICCASIYVTSEGVWKLGGLQFLMKFSDITPADLEESRKNRYEKAIPPEEFSYIPNAKVNVEAADKYAFGVLVEELLKKKSSDEVPFLLEFQDYCKKQLQNSNPGNRINLSEVLQHPFFNHDFIKIFKFLLDLPLKTISEREQFFSDLTEQLYLLPEDVVGCQLTSLLLSRVVLLDTAAQKHLLPVLLQPKMDEKQNGIALFSENVFKKYIIPKLLKIFCVRDAQIRMILLNNFHLFCHAFTAEQLRHHILPELLLGIKDVNDQLVSMTLKALSQLVMILGAATVIGGKRGKFFTDGRPNSQISEPLAQTKRNVKDKKVIIQSPLQSNSEVLFAGLPERPSPDGGEGNFSSSSIEEGDTEHWSDWDLPTEKNSTEIIDSPTLETLIEPPAETIKTGEALSHKNSSEITYLDIKSGTNETLNGGDVDFFRDMEPVISKTQILRVNPTTTKFDVESDEPGSNWDGWEEDWALEGDKISEE